MNRRKFLKGVIAAGIAGPAAASVSKNVSGIHSADEWDTFEWPGDQLSVGDRMAELRAKIRIEALKGEFLPNAEPVTVTFRRHCPYA